MSFPPLSRLVANIVGCGPVAVAFPVAAVVLTVVVKLINAPQLGSIPTVGSSTWLESCLASFKYLSNAREVIQEGYEKHKLMPFKVATPGRWTVIVCSRKHVEEMQRAPSDTLSFGAATDEQLQIKYTMGSEVLENPSHVPVVRSQLTRNLGALVPDIRDEITVTFHDILDLNSNEWKSVPALRTIQRVVCRASNRVFVGLPLCRDPDWMDLNIGYTLDIIKGANIIGLFPDLLKPIVARFLTNVGQSNERGRKLLGPVIEERLRHLNDYGDEWVDRPNDFLSWLIEEAKGPDLTIESLTSRILFVNFAAIHTTSHSFTIALLYLAANPQYIKPLREEVEGIIEKEGWSKVALGKMRKVDSFIKECQRLDGIASASVTRKALKDFTFSDGVFVPKGTMITVAARAIHYDEAFYGNAHAFEPFRFADMLKEGEESVKYSYATPATEYLPFGRGRHACPGRFFAGNEMKVMLAHIVATYDVKLPDDATRQPALYFGTAVVADPSFEVMFRRRVD